MAGGRSGKDLMVRHRLTKDFAIETHANCVLCAVSAVSGLESQREPQADTASEQRMNEAIDKYHDRRKRTTKTCGTRGGRP